MSLPPPPPPPAMASPLPPPPSSPAPPPRRGLTAVSILIGAVVGILVLGGILLLISRLTSGDDIAAAPAPDTPVGTPVGEESPGIIVPLTDQPTPSVEPIPPEDAPTPPVEPDVPEPEDAPTSSPDPDVPEPEVPAGTPLPLGAGISVTPPEGWTGTLVSDGVARLSAPDKAVLVLRDAVPPGTTGAQVVSIYVAQVLERDFAEVTIGSIDPVTTDVPSIVSAAFVTYDAVVVTQQGSGPVAGAVYTFVRADGVVTVVQAINLPGQPFPEELNQIIISMLQTM